MILHNSHIEYFRSPFGAIKYGSFVNISLDTTDQWQGAKVILRTWQTNRGETLQNMTADNEGIRHSLQIDTRNLDFDLLWYYFIVEHNGHRIYYGNNPDSFGGVGVTSLQPPNSYQISLYSSVYPIPNWFKTAVVYQIFPDRFFRRGKLEDIPEKPGAIFHNSWDDLPIYVKDGLTGEKFDLDYFGGNLRGIQKKLPYLQELGISVIYLNPIFEADSNHRYNTSNYLKIDKILGSNKDFTRLCERAKEYGIKIVLDGVFSHTGSNSIYFNKDGKYESLGAFQSIDSPYYSWFKFSNHPEEYKCWWGVKTLPETNELEASFQNFIIDNPDSVVNQWLNAGAEGWRLDVADELPVDFLAKFYSKTKENKPDAVVIGEVWEDASNKKSYGEVRNYFCGGLVDSVMNYPLREIFLDFALGKTSAEQVGQRLLSLYENYPKENFYALLNLIGSHDRARALSILGNDIPINDYAAPLTCEQYSLGVSRLKMLAVWQMTFPGVPCIYYGDEVGIQGGKDPFNRACYPWGREDKDLFTWYKQLIHLRNGCKALQDGDWEIVHTEDQVFAYLRTGNCEEKDLLCSYVPNSLLIVLNAGDKTIISLNISCNNLTNIFDNQDVAKIVEGKAKLDIPALTGKIYIVE